MFSYKALRTWQSVTIMMQEFKRFTLVQELGLAWPSRVFALTFMGLIRVHL